MKHEIKREGDTKATLTIKADEKDLADIKRVVLNNLRPKIKSDGFRPGKAPDSIVEKQIGANQVQQEVMEAAINRFYGMAGNSEKLKPLSRPTIDLVKFVAYTELEFTAEVELLPPIKLGDYKKKPAAPKPAKVTKKEVDEALERLAMQMAEKKEVKRAAKNGDEVIIDFKGTDAKGELVKGAESKEYPLTLGSDSFIPGFEPELIGLKAGEEKTFTITFPKEYHSKILAGTKVTFEIKVHKVNELVAPKFDDEFAAANSPFKTMEELRADAERQLEDEKQQQIDKDYRQKVVSKVVDESKLELPEGLVDRVEQDMKAEFERELAQRNSTTKEYMQQQDLTQKQLDKETRENAEKRAKTSLVLTEIAEAEGLKVSVEELEKIIADYKQMYGSDEKIAAELDKPEVRQDIAAQALTEKTVDFLAS
jgi:trigger factor